ncbi:DUF3613 domain-containing protein [Halomonas organivorans]
MHQADTPLSRFPLSAWVLCLALVPASTPAWSGEGDAASRSSVAAATPLHRVAPGERVERLLESQRDGRLASARPQTLSGEVQSRIHRRYVDSFSHPIPDTYIDMDFVD